MKKSFSLALILTITAIIFYITKPSDEACLEKAVATFRENKLNLPPNLPTGIHAELLKQTAEKAFFESLKVEDKVLFKEIIQEKGGSSTRIGWGALTFISIDVK